MRHEQMIELLTTSEMAQADAIAVRLGTESYTLMQRAGAPPQPAKAS